MQNLPVRLYIRHRLIILDEEIDVTTAVKWMHDKKSATSIVRNNDMQYVGIVTKHDI